MGDTLNLFPQRAAIGRADADGNVYMTLEFSRALASLRDRVGGDVFNSLDEVALELATTDTASGAQLAQRVADLTLALTQTQLLVARLAELGKQVAALEAALVNVTPPADWEHPGAIGARKANTGAFTTVNKVKITAPAGTATLTLGDGKMFTVSNTLTLTANDGATLAIGAGGTLGSAAYRDAATFAARSNAALAPAATDAASTQALANSLRSILLAVGIGS